MRPGGPASRRVKPDECSGAMAVEYQAFDRLVADAVELPQIPHPVK